MVLYSATLYIIINHISHRSSVSPVSSRPYDLTLYFNYAADMSTVGDKREDVMYVTTPLSWCPTSQSHWRHHCKILEPPWDEKGRCDRAGKVPFWHFFFTLRALQLMCGVNCLDYYLSCWHILARFKIGYANMSDVCCLIRDFKKSSIFSRFSV